MNSIIHKTLAHCPNGCEPFEADCFCFIRTDENPELKEAMLGGELNLVCCPECGTYFHAQDELIYLDPSDELLVFLFPEKEQAQKDDLQKRIADDYRIIKDTLLKSLEIDYPPVCVFGLEQLKHLLENEASAALESEAVAAASAAEGFNVVRLKPAYARQHHFPFYVPAASHTRFANDYAVAAAQVLKSGLHSPLLLNFKDHMSQEEAVLPQIV